MVNTCIKVAGGAIAASLAFISTVALADGMPRGSVKDAPYVAPFSWTGFYVGGNIGAARVDADRYGALPADAASVFVANGCAGGIVCPTGRPAADGTGVIGGLQLGYNLQMSSFLLGIETDIQGSTARASSFTTNTNFAPGTPFNGAANTSLESLGTVRARLGVLVTPTLLAYATGGFAYGQVQRTYGFFFTGGATDATSGRTNDWRTGWTAGGGLEWAIANRVTLGAEYLFVDLDGGGAFNSNSLNTTGCGPAPGHCNLNVRGGDTETHIARLKVNFKL